MPAFTRRPATTADLDLLYDIVRECLRDYVIATWGAWDEIDQRRRFDEVTRVDHHTVLEVDGVTAGCLCADWRSADVYLARLLVLPQFQNRGIGTTVLRDLLAEADRAGLPVRLSVLRVNPARQLYERHGFVVETEDDVRIGMMRRSTAI